MMKIDVEVVEGSDAPKYSEVTQLTCEGVVVTEKGTEQGLPIVDFKMRDKNGKLHLLVLTGRVVNSISGIVKGVNMKNHGTHEP